jgi:bifunctional DNA-binding transcriptional regulator/antitoxin component of YhaV-PrlF toxin-antitoxin module
MTSTLNEADLTTISAEIRRKAGWEPGATLEWQIDDGTVVVRRRMPIEDATTVRLGRRNGKRAFPPSFTAPPTAIAKAIREERDSR